MKQIPTENPFNTIPPMANHSLGPDFPIEEWRLTRLELMLRFKKESNVYYKEAEEYLKENKNFDVEKDIGFIDEYPLSIDYIEPNVYDTPPFWQYLILYGGPGSEIRFFVNDKSSTRPYKVEFYFSDWSNSARQNVTSEAVIEHLWEQIMLPLTEQIEIQTQEPSRETQEADPLQALAGTLDLDVTKIKNHLKNAVRPKTRVVKGPYEDHPDPLIALLGTLECDVTDIGERHDDYIGDALLAELWGDEDE
ncbi:MAG: hypothetical protein OXU23_23315 [Candidatus Poribacteria bacterium]|nr:hypothetical protein [Candidatus Poribacteria bacterium]